MDRTIKCKASLSTFKKGGTAPCYQIHIKDPELMPKDAFHNALANKLGVTESKARFINETFGQVLCECILANKVVNLGWLRGQLAIGGSVSAVGAPLDKSNNPVMAKLIPWGELKATAESITAVNETLVVEAILHTVQYGTSDQLNTIEGTGVIKLNGSGLLITQANTDEGVWLESLEGEVISDKATISYNDENSIDCSFASLPEDLENGDVCRLVIATRNGESKNDYEAARLTRNVTIITANA